MAHLAQNGSDGFVVAGTTGEAANATDEEHLGLIDSAVRERPTLPSRPTPRSSRGPARTTTATRCS